MQNNIIFLTTLLLLSLQNSLATENNQSQENQGTKDGVVSELSNGESSLKNALPEHRLNKDINANYTKQNLTKSMTTDNTELLSEINEFKEKLESQNLVLYALNRTIIDISVNLTSSEAHVQNITAEWSRMKLEINKLKQEATNQTSTIAASDTSIRQSDTDTDIRLRKAQALITDLETTVKAMNQQIVDFKSEQSSIAMNQQIVDFKSEQSSIAESVPSSCVSFGDSNNVHEIKVEGFTEPFQVLCHSQLSTGPGWTVIQRRIDGSVDFYRGWEEYKTGFGDLTGEFFIGLEKLHAMTNAEPHELYIQMESNHGVPFYAQYDDIKIGSETEGYPLQKLGKYGGDLKNALRWIEGQKFTTVDRDNDNNDDGNCADLEHGAWWYTDCGFSNLNGAYGDRKYEMGIYWDEPFFSMKSVLMMIRPRET